MPYLFLENFLNFFKNLFYNLRSKLLFPLNYNLTMKLHLTDKKKETSDTTSFIFKPEVAINWRVGQFMHYFLDHQNIDSRKADRYFTIASAPHEGVIQLTTRMAIDHSSSFKKALNNLQVGQTIDALGPDGDFIITNPNQEFVFIAGGVGITPFRAILLDLAYKNLPINVNLLHGNRTNEIIFKKELTQIAKTHPQLKIRYYIDPDKIDQSAIQQAVTDLQKPIFYISGPKPLVESLSSILAQMGIPKNHLKRDFFPGYTWP